MLPTEVPRPQRTVRFVAPREAAAVVAGQPRAPPPRQQLHESDNEEVKVMEEMEEEQTLGQLRDQLTRVPAPGPRAARVLIKIEDSTSGKDVYGDGEGDTLADSVQEHRAGPQAARDAALLR
jgi:hypothetical protein